MEFTYTQRVYYSDTDCGGIVYHTKYLDFAEHARTEMLRDAFPELGQGRMKDDDGIIFVVKSIKIDYKAPAFLDDMLTVKTRMIKAERFSATFSQLIMRKSDVLCNLEVRVASVSYKDKKLVPIPQKVLDALS